MKSTKATGLDGIPARLLKDAANEISRPIGLPYKFINFYLYDTIWMEKC